MKTGIFITARLGSTRLEKKHLLPVNGRPLLSYLFMRIRNEFRSELDQGSVKLVIVTSDEPENRKFEIFSPDGIAVFYGSKNNIPLRHHQASTALSLDGVISVDGDDILCSAKGMRAIYDALALKIPYAKTSGLPLGMNSIGYSRTFLGSSLIGHTDDILETGWGRIFDSKNLKNIHIDFPIQSDDLRFTLDYPEDYRFFDEVIRMLGEKIAESDDERIVRTVIENKLHLITEPIVKEYWKNFYKKQAQEAQDSPA
jgi:spore coat polysaccharide biosynthesis protein SpsF